MECSSSKEGMSEPSLAPAVIRKLPEHVVNRIAAGEVIQRPSNAVKELLENALDAKSTKIGVVVRDGGLSLLQISDNGTGIAKNDLILVCERFTTSKLRDFDDLKSIHTYGFRGEALASVSHVAKLKIVTRTRDEKVGYVAHYSDGKLTAPPKPCAAVEGTQILAEDLFFNVPLRKKALKSTADEFNRVYDVVSKYAIHNSGAVGFSLKKDGDRSLALRTDSQNSLKENIGLVYGCTLANELEEVQIDESETTNSRYKFIENLEGMISKVNYSPKKFNFILFINHRLVECSALKKAIEIVYNAYLPKGSHPFVYLSLQMNPKILDVNVHPTKHEVYFLHQEELIECVQQTIDRQLLKSNSSRTFYTQALLPGAPPPSKDAIVGASKKTQTSSVNPSQLVRTSGSDQKLDKFLTTNRSQRVNEEKRADGIENDAEVPKSVTASLADENGSNAKCPGSEGMIDQNRSTFGGPKDRAVEAQRREIKLTSLLNLRKVVHQATHEGLRSMFLNHCFVGLVDHRLCLVQHETQLLLWDMCRITEEFFYQQMLRDFGNFAALKLNPAPNMKELVLLALEGEKEMNEERRNQLADFIVNLLCEQAEMLDDYFAIGIDVESGTLSTLPLLLNDFIPCFKGLPVLLIRLASEVNWEEEESCFEGICRELANFYATDDNEQSTARYDAEQHSSEVEDGDSWKTTFEHILLPALKSKFLYPPKKFAEDLTVVQAANLPDLYKVFERC